MKDYRNLLNIKPQKAGKYKNKLYVYVNWDSECDLEDKIRRQNERNEWYDSWN